MTAGAEAILKMPGADVAQAHCRVKISLPDVLASCVVIPQLEPFLSDYPRLAISIDCGIVALDDSTPDITVQFIDLHTMC